MINCLLATCSNRVYIDARTNEVAIIGLYEEVVSQGFPVVMAQITSFFLLTRDDGDPTEYDARIVITLGDTELFRGPIQIDFLDKHRNRTTLLLQGLVLQSPGTVKAALIIGDEEIAAWQFPVRLGEGAVLPLRIEKPHQEEASEETSD